MQSAPRAAVLVGERNFSDSIAVEVGELAEDLSHAVAKIGVAFLGILQDKPFGKGKNALDGEFEIVLKRCILDFEFDSDFSHVLTLSSESEREGASHAPQANYSVGVEM